MASTPTLRAGAAPYRGDGVHRTAPPFSRGSRPPGKPSGVSWLRCVPLSRPALAMVRSSWRMASVMATGLPSITGTGDSSPGGLPS
ncbi:hypothetical protein SAMN04488509_102232 [Aquimonas voraii]|uniref:Uncharacterized protein n=1 Tax=Aquimonas voraii TaxID=265719 RepID=A0A1G6U9T9_9GAMM|nr:hypothetical protein SAMN04488509_102232 [Aquimonas voraii]